MGSLLAVSSLKASRGLRAKTYEQSIGFLRIIDGDEPLDLTPIHPEIYEAVKMLYKNLTFIQMIWDKINWQML